MSKENVKVFYTKHFFVNIYVDNRNIFDEIKKTQLIIFLYQSFFVLHGISRKRAEVKTKRENNIIGLSGICRIKGRERKHMFADITTYLFSNHMRNVFSYYDRALVLMLILICCCLREYACMWPLFIQQRKKKRNVNPLSFQSNVNEAFEISYLSLSISLYFFSVYITLLITNEFDDEEE